MMEDRICTLSKQLWFELLESIPVEARLTTNRWQEEGIWLDHNYTAIVLHSPFLFRLLFVAAKEASA